MTPAEIRQIARQEAERAVANGGGASLPSIWTNEVQIYNSCLTSQGVRTLRGLAGVVCDLQSNGGGGTANGPPCTAERFVTYEAGQVSRIDYGTNLGGDGASIERTQQFFRDDDGRVETILDTWTRDATLYGRTVTLTYDDATGLIESVVCGDITTPPPIVIGELP